MALIQKAFSDIITFSRSSNATRIGPNGLVQYAPHNLSLRSQEFDNASWTKSGATVTANAITAPDGTVTADKMIESATTAVHGLYQTATVVANIPHTVSVYAKAGERNWLVINPFTTGSSYVYFDLTNGVVGTIGSGITASIQSVGNGWYRCIATRTPTTTYFEPNIQVTTANGTPSYTGDGISGIFIWGAQLAVGPLALDYTPTTTAAVYGPRFDYDGSAVTSVDPIARNLVLYSEQFDNAAWSKQEVTVTADAATSPDGTTTAEKLAETTNTNEHAVYRAYTSVAATAYTLSVYAKASERTFLALTLGIANSIAWFNLSSGVVGTVQSAVTATIQSIGNGWYRCSITGTPGASTQNAVIETGLSNGVNNYAGTTGSGIFIWGAQLEVGSTATGYMVSGATNGFRAVPVVTGNATARGLLVEEQRTNLATYSEQFDNAAWTKSNLTLTADSVAAPDGTITADLIYPASSGDRNSHRLIRSFTVSNATSYTASVFVKSAGKQWVYFSAPDASSNAHNCWFDVVNGVVGTKGASVTVAAITNFGNGWFRLSVTSTSTSTTNYVLLTPVDGDNNSTVTASGTSGIYLWGAQLEAGSFATSYIPTVASTVTRSADVASVNTLSPWHNASESTLYCEFDYIGSTGSSVPAAFAKLSSASDDGMMVWRNLAGSLLLYNGPATFGNFSTLQPNTNYKTAIARDGSSGVTSANGSNQTAWASSVTATILRLGNYDGTQYFANGHLRRVSYYPRKLSSAELSALTA